jgi:hypothetical protein
LVKLEADKIQDTIIALATRRGADKTICPSEVARALFSDNWRTYMVEVRNAAVNLHQQGRVAIVQKGVRIDVNHIKGPIRIKIVTPGQ